MTNEYKQYLAHYGIKGQKWGVRRFQLENGTLTEEGKKRYLEAQSWEKDDVNNLSNEEIDRRNARMSKENTYKNNLQNRHPVEKEIKDSAKKVFVSTAVGAAAAYVGLKYKNALNKIGGGGSGGGTGGGSGGSLSKLKSAGKGFLKDNRRLLGLGSAVAVAKGSEYWKKKNDEAGKDPTFSDFAYNHRGALGLAAYVAVNRIIKRL